jgi:hypothetical protein
MTQSSTDSSLVERLRDGVPLTEVDGREVADTDAADATMEWAANVILSLTAQRDAFREKAARMGEALEWYGEQARLARLIHSGGDAGRHALAEDGGKRASADLQSEKDREGQP